MSDESAGAPAAAPRFVVPSWVQGLTGLLLVAMTLWLSVAWLREPMNGGTRLVPHKWLQQDGSFYYLTLRGLVDDLSLRQDQLQPRSWYELELGFNHDLPADWSNVSVGTDGHWYPKHGVLWPFAAIPAWLVFDAWGALGMNLLCLVLLPWLTFRIGRHLVPWWAAAVAAGVFGASPYLVHQAYFFSNDLFYAALVLGAVERALAKREGASGLLFGLAVFAKLTNAVLLPGLLLLLWGRAGPGWLKRFVLGALPPLVVFAALNTACYGAPWLTGYSRILVRQGGAQTLHDHARDFDWAHTVDLVRDLVWTRRGDFGMHDRAPFWHWAALGIPFLLWRAPRLALGLLWMVVSTTVFHAPFKHFRVEFLNFAVALSMPFAAAPLLLLMKLPELPTSPVSRVKWSRLGPALFALYLLIGLPARYVVEPRGQWGERHLRDATTTLGAYPCDYFNWQMERFECFAQGRDELMVGRRLQRGVTFKGARENLITWKPHPSRQAWKMAWPAFSYGQKLAVRYGFAEGEQPNGELRFVALVGDQAIPLPLPPPGELHEELIDTAALAGKGGPLAFTFQSANPENAALSFDFEAR